MSALEIVDSIAALTFVQVGAPGANLIATADNGPCNAVSVSRISAGVFSVAFDPPLQPDSIAMHTPWEVCTFYQSSVSVEADGTVTMRFQNAAGAAVDPSPTTFHSLLVIRL